ncbi:MAG TPA: ABC transporter ATP-binding protein [Balneolales bacterium]|nr:ABC transporter ATP-binding protein [Balneolales bacterium]
MKNNQRNSDSYIRILDLSKSYEEGGRNHKVLTGINLEVKQGERVILLGKSGSGKSTFLNLVGGMDLPDDGHIFINGDDITRKSETERTLFRRRRLGFVFQFFNLVPTLTVRENLMLPLELNEMLDGDEKSRINDLLEEVGLASRSETYPDRLSGGEQQRVAIARALIHKPDLIIADEPTGNLDEHTEQQVLELLNRLTRTEKRTLLMATHSREIASMGDRILTLHEGRLQEEITAR